MARNEFFIVGLMLCLLTVTTSNGDSIDVVKRSRHVDSDGWLRIDHAEESWIGDETAVIVCDMWDSHHCLNAVRRVKQLAPRIDRFLKKARDHGVTIIHAPSSCMEFYKDHPGRKKAMEIPKAANAPERIESWCHWKNKVEESTGYPIDHTDGGEDDDLEEHARWAKQLESMGRDPRSPWKSQIDTIEIADEDYITDDGIENWSILEKHGIKNVMLVGVHTNMCVLGRPFGLRQMANANKNVVLVRDLTDTMYNPKMPPFVSHFSGTDLIIEHIEQYVCPTISSDQLLGGKSFRFYRDRRPRIVLVIGEQEYQTQATLPPFARKHLYRDFHVSYVLADKKSRNEFGGTEAIAEADLLLVSVRRRTPSTQQLEAIRGHVAAGKPVVGIRTASHAFSLRGKKPQEGLQAWEEFDAEVFGGSYTGHHGNKQSEDDVTFVWMTDSGKKSPIMAGYLAPYGSEQKTTSWLYKTSPLKPGANVLMMGRVGDRKPHEPVTWTYINIAGGRSFYTSLGHPDEFAQPAFQEMLKRGIYWALDLPLPPEPATISKTTDDESHHVSSVSAN